jgi:type VI secretion system protein ImpC
MSEALAQSQQESGTLEMSDFGALLHKEFKPQSDKDKESV